MTCPCGQWPTDEDDCVSEALYGRACEFVEGLLELVGEPDDRRAMRLVDDARRFLREMPAPVLL